MDVETLVDTICEGGVDSVIIEGRLDDVGELTDVFEEKPELKRQRAENSRDPAYGPNDIYKILEHKLNKEGKKMPRI